MAARFLRNLNDFVITAHEYINDDNDDDDGTACRSSDRRRRRPSRGRGRSRSRRRRRRAYSSGSDENDSSGGSGSGSEEEDGWSSATSGTGLSSSVYDRSSHSNGRRLEERRGRQREEDAQRRERERERMAGAGAGAGAGSSARRRQQQRHGPGHGQTGLRRQRAQPPSPGAAVGAGADLLSEDMSISRSMMDGSTSVDGGGPRGSPPDDGNSTPIAPTPGHGRPRGHASLHGRGGAEYSRDRGPSPYHGTHPQPQPQPSGSEVPPANRYGYGNGNGNGNRYGNRYGNGYGYRYRYGNRYGNGNGYGQAEREHMRLKQERQRSIQHLLELQLQVPARSPGGSRRLPPADEGVSHLTLPSTLDGAADGVAVGSRGDTAPPRQDLARARALVPAAKGGAPGTVIPSILRAEPSSGGTGSARHPWPCDPTAVDYSPLVRGGTGAPASKVRSRNPPIASAAALSGSGVVASHRTLAEDGVATDRSCDIESRRPGGSGAASFHNQHQHQHQHQQQNMIVEAHKILSPYYLQRQQDPPPPPPPLPLSPSSPPARPLSFAAKSEHPPHGQQRPVVVTPPGDLEATSQPRTGKSEAEEAHGAAIAPQKAGSFDVRRSAQEGTPSLTPQIRKTLSIDWTENLWSPCDEDEEDELSLFASPDYVPYWHRDISEGKDEDISSEKWGVLHETIALGSEIISQTDDTDKASEGSGCLTRPETPQMVDTDVGSIPDVSGKESDGSCDGTENFVERAPDPPADCNYPLLDNSFTHAVNPSRRGLEPSPSMPEDSKGDGFKVIAAASHFTDFTTGALIPTDDFGFMREDLISKMGEEEEDATIARLSRSSDPEEHIPIAPRNKLEIKAPVNGPVDKIKASTEIWESDDSLSQEECEHGVPTSPSLTPGNIEFLSAIRIQRLIRGLQMRHRLLVEMGVAKRRKWERRTKTKEQTRIHSDIRRLSRAYLRHRAFVLDIPGPGSMVLAVRRVCAVKIQRWFLQKNAFFRAVWKSITGFQALFRGYSQRQKYQKMFLARPIPSPPLPRKRPLDAFTAVIRIQSWVRVCVIRRAYLNETRLRHSYSNVLWDRKKEDVRRKILSLVPSVNWREQALTSGTIASDKLKFEKLADRDFVSTPQNQSAQNVGSSPWSQDTIFLSSSQSRDLQDLRDLSVSTIPDELADTGFANLSASKVSGKVREELSALQVQILSGAVKADNCNSPSASHKVDTAVGGFASHSSQFSTTLGKRILAGVGREKPVPFDSKKQGDHDEDDVASYSSQLTRKSRAANLIRQRRKLSSSRFYAHIVQPAEFEGPTGRRKVSPERAGSGEEFEDPPLDHIVRSIKEEKEEDIVPEDAQSMIAVPIDAPAPIIYPYQKESVSVAVSAAAAPVIPPFVDGNVSPDRDILASNKTISTGSISHMSSENNNSDGGSSAEELPFDIRRTTAIAKNVAEIPTVQDFFVQEEADGFMEELF